MIYVYYADVQRSFLKREAAKQVKSALSAPNEFNYLRVDAKETTVQEIVDACLEVPMLENKKVVVVEDAFFVASTKSKEKINKENDYDKLVKYIAHPVKETDLILLVYADKLDARGKIYKSLADAGVAFTNFAPLKEREWENYTAQLVAKVKTKFDNQAINELARRTLNDRDRLINEIEKLSLYQDHISLNDVVTLVSEPIEEKAFTLTNALFKGNVSEAMYIYRDLLTKNMDPNSLLTMIANQFRFIYLVLYLRSRGETMADIATKLNAKEFRVKMAITNGAMLSHGISPILEEIYQVDENIKSGRVDRFVAFEMFLLHFKKNYL